jgi:predicted enzyme related to lactoylglutathione lyase
MGAPIVHFEILGVDFQKTKEFYSNMFGWTMQDSPGMNYALVDSNVKMGINGGLGQIDPGKTPYVAVYVQVEDPQAYLDKAVSLGAKVVAPVTVVPDMVTFALFADPAGCMVGLVKGPQTPPKAKPKGKPKKKEAKKKPVRKVKGSGKKRGRK